MDHWDPNTSLDLWCEVQINLDQVIQECELGTDPVLGLMATWRAESVTRLAGTRGVVELGADEELSGIPLHVHVPAGEAGGILRLEVKLVLVREGKEAGLFAAHRPGSVLWSTMSRVHLEGDAPRFPMGSVDFSKSAARPDEALWMLDWEPGDWDAPVAGGLQLLLNSNVPDVPLLAETGSRDPRARLFRSFVKFDVARTLVQAALLSEEFVEAPDGWESGSVGKLVFELIDSVWNGKPVASLAQTLRSDPSVLAAQMQEKLKVSA